MKSLRLAETKALQLAVIETMKAGFDSRDINLLDSHMSQHGDTVLVYVQVPVTTREEANENNLENLHEVVSTEKITRVYVFNKLQLLTELEMFYDDDKFPSTRKN